MTEKSSGELATTSLQDEVRRLWDRNATFWDERMGEGNAFHQLLVAPAAEALLQPQPGERVLEFACGNGQFARALARLGVSVFATDQSEVFIDRARARLSEEPDLSDRLTFEVLHAADLAALERLPAHAFDAAVCNMALMDMVDPGPMFRALPRLLKSGGRFVAVTAHPCFNHIAAMLGAEEEDRQGTLVETRYVRVTKYLSPRTERGMGMVDQPAPQIYFHRSLSDLLQPAFAAGLTLDGMTERAFPQQTEPSWFLAWQAYPEIPPIFAFRLRVASQQR